MSGTTCYQRKREVILNRAKDYYKNSRDELKVKSKGKYRNYLKKKKCKERIWKKQI